LYGKNRIGFRLPLYLLAKLYDRPVISVFF
jgi:hypothetical protein